MNTETRRQFPAFEATRLNIKFKQLWLAGIEAKLVFETHAGQAWGTLHVSLGEHPGHHLLPCHGQEPHHRHVSPGKQRRRERREAARAVVLAAVKAAVFEEAEQATEQENENETEDQTFNSETSKLTAGVLNDPTDVIKDTVEVSASVEESAQQLFITDIDDEICSDGEYYEKN